MKITLKNVRLSFPAIWKPKGMKNDPSAKLKFSATFLLRKTEDAAQIDALRVAVTAVGKAQWPAKMPATLKYCVHDGKEKEDMDGYGPDVIYITASNELRVKIVDSDPSIPLAEEDGKPYAGCYVNAVIRLWAQDNQFGKRINAQLCGIQFYKDGESFGDKPFNAEEEFENVTEKGEPTTETEPAAGEQKSGTPW